MLKILTAPQLNIVMRAKMFFKNIRPDDKVRSMFRETSTGMIVGLAYFSGGQTHIVRETIGADLPDHEIDKRLGNLGVCLASSIAKVATADEAA